MKQRTMSGRKKRRKSFEDDFKFEREKGAEKTFS